MSFENDLVSYGGIQHKSRLVRIRRNAPKLKTNVAECPKKGAPKNIKNKDLRRRSLSPYGWIDDIRDNCT